MRKIIIAAAVLALLISAGGYALSQGYNYGGGKTGAFMGWGGQGMMGPGMMGASTMGFQGQTPINPETQQPYTPEEWNETVQQMHNACGSFMGYSPGTDL
jgi:hypothetical protein